MTLCTFDEISRLAVEYPSEVDITISWRGASLIRNRPEYPPEAAAAFFDQVGGLRIWDSGLQGYLADETKAPF